MEKRLFFDVQLGASGDMLLGALLDIGLNFDSLMCQLGKLNLPLWNIAHQKIVRNSIAGTRANVTCRNEKHHRNFNDIQTIITNSVLTDKIKNNILNIFKNLAASEAKVHGKPVENIYFHEVGAIDSIIDISSFCISMDILNIKKIYFNNFGLGNGTVKSSHGEIPVPVPAVVELLKNYKTILTDKSAELITPTAAAILTTLGEQIEEPFSFTLHDNGIGFGTREYPFPSFTRSFLISIDDKNNNIFQLECNIDDMNPQLYPFIIEKLLAAGALDVFTTNISMKKGRPGILLTVLTNTNNISQIKDIIYTHTTTLGLREQKITREKLDRKFDSVRVFNQEIQIKIGYYKNKIINIHPEFEDCEIISNKMNIPLKEVMAEAIKKFKNRKKINML